MQPLHADDPRTIGPYRLLRRIGSGGMGRVYLGRSAGGRTVAVKVVHPHFAADERFRARFRLEVDSARRVGGDWTAPVLDAGPDAPVPWVATGYVAGPALSRAVTDAGPLPEHTVRTLGAGLAEALAAVHGLGLVHRDVKPSNVLLTVDGPRLIDFGIARATDAAASLTASGVSVGSPGYMSPEQILGGTTTGASDVFSLGAVLAFAVTGSGPFPGGSSASLLYKVVHEEPELGGLEGDLRELVAGCLAKDAADRPGPAEIARRLAPRSGAEGLVRTGWLPGPLVEQAGRSAVELLDLEAEPGPSGPAGSPGPADPVEPAAWPPQPPGDGSGLVTMPPAQYPATGPGGVPAATSSGGYGPPHHSYARGGPGPTAGGQPRVPAQGQSPPRPMEQAGQAGAVGQPTGQRAERPAGRGGFSVSASATATSPRSSTGRRPRRLSCVLVLSVAATLALGTSVAAFLDVLPGQGNQPDANNDQGTGGAAQPPPESAVPKAFLGIWQGGVVQKDGFPNGEVTVVVKKGQKGDDVAELRYSVLGMSCHAKGELVSATKKKLTFRETSDTSKESAAGVCTGNSATVTLTDRPGDALRYASDDERGGRPSAELTRVDD